MDGEQDEPPRTVEIYNGLARLGFIPNPAELLEYALTFSLHGVPCAGPSEPRAFTRIWY